MKIVLTEVLRSEGTFPKSKEWKKIQKDIRKGISMVHWPPDSGSFTIFPESGKRRGMGNGVKPIKESMMQHLLMKGWKLEERMDIATVIHPGALDAVLYTKAGPLALEWETGNISSTHRALNKMALGIMKEKLIGGVLIIPSRSMCQYLTDRVGNWSEIEPYLDLWRSIPCSSGILEIIVIEHDSTSKKVTRIPKGTDGRALA